MTQEPEKMPLPGLMLGLKVVVEYMKGPQLTEENLSRVLDEGETLMGQAEARTALLYLETYSAYGIEVSKEFGAKPTYFIPWSAVLAMYTLENREELVERAKKDSAES